MRSPHTGFAMGRFLQWVSLRRVGRIAPRSSALRVCAAMTGLPAAAVVFFHAAVCVLPYPRRLDSPPPRAVWFEERSGADLAAFVSSDQQWRLPVSLDRISPYLVKAVVAVEDHRFYQHGGVDWRAAIAAAVHNAAAMAPRRGASTITMQVQRLRDGGPRTLSYKLLQAVRAVQLERRMTKDEILLEYLNRAPFGGNLVGAEAASRWYFNRPCSQLSLAQAALLAGLPQSPNRLRPDRHPAAARARRDLVLQRMLQTGAISPEEYRQAMAEPVLAAWRRPPQTCDSGGSCADGALPTLLHLASRADRPVMRTTIDAGVQRMVYLAARRHLQSLATGEPCSAAVVVLDTPSACCLAAASVGDAGLAVDLTRRPRSTGSALKPFIYAAGFAAGIAGPSTLIDDSPVAWPDHAPVNFDHAFRGAMSAADALSQSRNIPAMALLARLGAVRAVGVLQSSGVVTPARAPERYGLSLAIGGAEATALELAEAYATLARGGVHLPVTFVAGGKPEGRRVFPEPVCRQILKILSDRTYTGATSTGAAWKTGTSSGRRDAWCAAVTAQYTVVVWIGNLRGRGDRLLVGQDAAAPLALSIIAALAGGHAEAVVQYAGPSEAAPARLRRGPGHGQPIAIVSPADGAQIIIDPDLPTAVQRVALRALPAPDAAADRRGDSPPLLWWFVGGRLVGAASADMPVMWSPAPGRHEVRVVDASGRAGTVRISVREASPP